MVFRGSCNERKTCLYGPIGDRMGLETMSFFTRLFQRNGVAPKPEAKGTALELDCQADLWCRKRASISTMLDPELYARYMTGDDRIDEDWVIQSNPPCAFKVEFTEGCQALLDLLKIDPGLHATRGRLVFYPPKSATEADRQAYWIKLQSVVKTAQREMKIGI